MTFPRLIPPALVVLAVAGLTACGSAASTASGAGTPGTASAPAAASSASSASAPQAASEAVTVACQQVSAALSDGPDPDADPVGYAEAQVIPLRQIHTQDTALRDAIGRLAAAYQDFFTSNGTKTAKEAVSVASSEITSICPGATS
jgi:hypothetical protein